MVYLKLTMYQILTDNYKEEDRSPTKVVHVTLMFNNSTVSQEGVGEYVIVATPRLT